MHATYLLSTMMVKLNFELCAKFGILYPEQTLIIIKEYTFLEEKKRIIHCQRNTNQS